VGGARWRDHASNHFTTGSVRASALRGILVVAAVVLGSVILANAFPDSTGPRGAVAQTQSPSPEPSESNSPSPPKPNKPKCQVENVKVAVDNGTDVTGLAAATAETLQAKGYTPVEIGDAPDKPVETTILNYVGPQGKVEAKCLAKKIFKGALLRPLPEGTGLPVLTQVAIYIGEDYAATHPVG
jgi:hypothetical protein